MRTFDRGNLRDFFFPFFFVDFFLLALRFVISLLFQVLVWVWEAEEEAHNFSLALRQ